MCQHATISSRSVFLLAQHFQRAFAKVAMCSKMVSAWRRLSVRQRVGPIGLSGPSAQTPALSDPTESEGAQGSASKTTASFVFSI